MREPVPEANFTRPRVRTIRHNALVERLEPAQREQLRLLLLDPATRLVTVRRWLAVLGHPASMPGLCRFRQHLLREQQRLEDDAREAEDEAADAVAYALAARDTPTVVFHRASVYVCQLAIVLSIVELRSLDLHDAVAAARSYVRAMVLLEEARLLLPASYDATCIPQADVQAHTDVETDAPVSEGHAP